ncbi:heterokaryon incompatibility protein [Diplodia corticola]|uniref:Heterokaryon incompatibility protein n=1 Tax=Diplodia corticola TaxID=236234 RepID=A0A1J9QP85_9PEZI|nr:heterokaryon incompatibility protein [Diplodia corticola]OJD30264.1 heterokaryon incompatibility protein [Diplodia corticola]
MINYKPLSPDGSDIRVVQIVITDTTTSTHNGMVHCRLKHIPFKKKPTSRASSLSSSSSSLGQWIPLSSGATTAINPNVNAIELSPRITGTAATDCLWDPSKVPHDEQLPDASATSKAEARGGDDNARVEDGDYAALSYVWGDPTRTAPIVVNGAVVQVTKNLEAALRELRGRLPRDVVRRKEEKGEKEEEEGKKEEKEKQGQQAKEEKTAGLWVDALCINQSSLAERSKEVTRMRAIYASAREVIAWLGPATAGSDIAMTAIEWLSARAETGCGLDAGFYHSTRAVDMRPLFVKWARHVSPMRREVYRALYDLFARPYWRRLWILQEAALAGKVSPVLCGGRGVVWGDVFRAAELIQADEHRFGWDVLEAGGSKFGGFEWDFTGNRLPLSDHADDVLDSERLWKFLLEIEALQTVQHSDAPIETPDVLRTLGLSRDAQATNDKDKVYGILSLRSIAGASSQITPDYGLNTTDIYRQFTQAMFSSGRNLSGLRLIYSPIGQVQGSYEMFSRMLPAK